MTGQVVLYGELTPQNWVRQNAGLVADQIHEGEIDPNDPDRTTADWIMGREVRIYSMLGINHDAAYVVKQGIDEMAGEIYLGMDVGIHKPSAKLIRHVNSFISPDGIDYEGLSHSLALGNHRKPIYGGKPHADVVLIDGLFHDDGVSWGTSRFPTGTAIFALGNGRQNNTRYLRNVAKHEAGHLFGYMLHHEDVQIPELDSENCVMEWDCPTEYLCDKCFNGMNAFWVELEEAVGAQFISPDSPYKQYLINQTAP